jgi:tripartite-type tricarboxylate transporter receptor subunit TctC
MQTRRALQSRRKFMTSVVATIAVAASGAHGEDSHWPDHPVRIIVPYPAGGSTDVLSRILAERMKEMFGQPFVIENRPGAGGNIGIAAVTGSPPDGYTIGAATIGHFAINQYLYSKMPYDAERDMIPASRTWELPNVFVVATDHCPANSVSEFVAWAKQKGQVSFGSPGAAPRRIFPV